MNSWKLYKELLQELEDKKLIELQYISKDCKHNAHMFYIKCKDLDERTKLVNFLKENEINAVFHYIPLHSAEAGLKFGRFYGEDIYTTKESERLLRLPLYYGLKEEDVKFVVSKIKGFYGKK